MIKISVVFSNKYNHRIYMSRKNMFHSSTETINGERNISTNGGRRIVINLRFFNNELNRIILKNKYIRLNQIELNLIWYHPDEDLINKGWILGNPEKSITFTETSLVLTKIEHYDLDRDFSVKGRKYTDIYFLSWTAYDIFKFLGLHTFSLWLWKLQDPVKL